MKELLQSKKPQPALAEQTPQQKPAATLADARPLHLFHASGTIAADSPGDQTLRALSTRVPHQPHQQRLRALSAQFQDSPRLAAQRQLDPASRSGGVVQRLVAPGLANGTSVVVKRSTSREFHGATATIVQSGPGPHEYVIDVGGELVIARLDQLEPAGTRLRDVETEADIGTIVHTNPDLLIEQVRKYVSDALGRTFPFVIGGSFAALIHALAAGQSARTPRDVDIIVDTKVWQAMGYSGGKPQRREEKIWGIPIEIHKAGPLVTPDKAEQAAGIINKNKLLAKALVKVRDQSDLFKEKTPAPKAAQNASVLLATMLAGNHELMANEDIGKNSKEVWLKTLADIQSLIRSGADLSEYNQVVEEEW